MILNKIFVSHFVQNNTKALKEEVLWTRKKKGKRKTLWVTWRKIIKIMWNTSLPLPPSITGPLRALGIVGNKLSLYGTRLAYYWDRQWEITVWDWSSNEIYDIHLWRKNVKKNSERWWECSTYTTFSSGKFVYSDICFAISVPSEHTHSSESTSSTLFETNWKQEKRQISIILKHFLS